MENSLVWNSWGGIPTPEAVSQVVEPKKPQNTSGGLKNRIQKETQKPKLPWKGHGILPMPCKSQQEGER